MKVHEDGDWLAEDDARPHDDVPHLTSEQGNGRDDSKGNLLVGVGGGGNNKISRVG